MGFPAYAFSVHNFINSVGADAGFAAVIGLAILVLLYFAQARETASLRENAQEAAARIMELERRLAQLSQAQPAAPAQGAVPGVAARPVANPISAAAVAAVGAGEIAASHHGQAAMAPSAPAGVGAPALTAATRMISTPVPTVAPAPAAPAPVPVGVRAAGAPATAAAAAPTAAPPHTNGTGEHAEVPPRPAAAAVAAAPQGRPPQGRPPVQGRPGGSGARPGGTAAARSGGLPPRGSAPRGTARSRFSRWLLAAVVVLGAAAVIVALLIVTSSGSTSTNVAQPSAATPTTNAPSAHHAARPKPFNPATVTVAVLNGTPVAGLAGRTATRLVNAGFKQGTVATAGDQTRQATIVAYVPGHSKDAAEVAKALKLGSASVQPIDQSTQSIACQGASPCPATVVVTVGADLQSR
jgi:LytR cell envelope-related transcriptional attenuator